MFLSLIHYLHLISAIIWAGGTLMIAWVVLPALARLPGVEARNAWFRMAPRIGPIMGAAAGLTMLLGLTRAVLGGGITGFTDLLQPYGLLVMTALALALVAEGTGSGFRARFAAGLTNETDFPAIAPRLAMINAMVQTLLMGAIIVVMVLLGMGLQSV